MKPKEVLSMMRAQIRDRSDRVVGEIEELVVNRGNGQIEAVVVKTPRQRITVPWTNLDFDENERLFRVSEGGDHSAPSPLILH